MQQTTQLFRMSCGAELAIVLRCAKTNRWAPACNFDFRASASPTGRAILDHPRWTDAHRSRRRRCNAYGLILSDNGLLLSAPRTPIRRRKTALAASLIQPPAVERDEAFPMPLSGRLV